MLLVLRQADFGIRTSHGVGVICIIFALWAVGPKLTNLVNPQAAFCMNMVFILAILVLGCHNVLMYNQSTFLLGYLLLQGYEVEGHAYLMRLAGLGAGMVICAAVFYKNHRKRTYKRSFADLFREIDIRSARIQWYFRLAFGISSGLLIASQLEMPRVMWVGIACMSLLLPFSKDLKYRVKRRAPFNILGCILFVAMYYLLPANIFALVGLIGGIGVGYSAGYSWQTVFNSFGAVAAASGIFGLKTAIILRIAANAFGSLYALAVDWGLQRFWAWISGLGRENDLSETV